MMLRIILQKSMLFDIRVGGEYHDGVSYHKPLLEAASINTQIIDDGHFTTQIMILIYLVIYLLFVI